MYKVVADAKQYLAKWNVAQGRKSSALLMPEFPGDRACSWVKPNLNIVKIMVDATIFEDRYEYGFGKAARYSEGVLLQAESRVK